MLYSIHNLVLTRPQRSGYRLRIKNLTVAPGETAAITGPSGCGKSTTLDILGMVLKPDNADCFVFNPGDESVDLAAAWMADRLDHMAALRREHIGYVLQTGGLLPFLTVSDNIALTAQLRGMPEAETEAMVRELAELLDIKELLHDLPNSLSVGERQRAAIGRALASRPDVVLADEPTAALDPVRARNVMKMFVKAAKMQSVTLLLVTHDTRIVEEFDLREIPVHFATGAEGITEAVIDDGWGNAIPNLGGAEKIRNSDRDRPSGGGHA